MVVALTAVFLVCGLVLLVFGWRGRRINDHPICRQCRFDLAGIFPAVTTCPECGTDLAPDKAVCRGARRKRRGPLLIGLVLLLASAGVAGTLVWSWGTNFNWNTIKPVWMLLREARSSGAVGGAAVDELRRRIDEDLVGDATLERLVRRAFEVQQSDSSAWHPAWGDIVEVGFGQGLLTGEQQQAYWERAISVSLATRARWDPTKPTRVGFYLNGTRLGTRPSAGFTIEPRSVHLDGGDIDLTLVSPARLELWADSMGLLWDPLQPGDWSVLGTGAPGTHDVTAMFRVAVFDLKTTSTLAAWNAEATGSVEVVEPGAPLALPVRDPSLAKAMRASITEMSIEAEYIAGRRADLRFHIWIERPPVAHAFRAYAKHLDHRHEIDVVEHVVGTWMIKSGIGGRLEMDDLDVTALTVVLEPAPELAEQAGLDEYWGEPIVIEDVPIELPKDE